MQPWNRPKRVMWFIWRIDDLVVLLNRIVCFLNTILSSVDYWNTNGSHFDGRRLAQSLLNLIVLNFSGG